MMDTIFQQAPFDDRNDLKRIEAIAKEVEQRARKMDGIHYGECYRCGWRGQGFAGGLNCHFLCVKCLIKDEVERRFKEAK